MDIIIFAVIALLLFLRLRSELGKIDEEEKIKIQKKFMNESAQSGGSVFSKTDKEEKIIGYKSTAEDEKVILSLDSGEKETLDKIFQSCKATPSAFISSAKTSFEIVIKSFAENDCEKMKQYLSENIYHIFESLIAQRKSEKKTLITNLISITRAEIMSAMMIENTASIIVKFTSRQINYLPDDLNQVVEGSKNEIFEVSDIWTFTRDIASQNQSWIICATNPN